MEQNHQNLAKEISNIYNRLNLIFHAILAPPLIALIWLYLESKAGSIEPLLGNQSSISMIGFVFPSVTIGIIAGSFYIFKSGLRQINPTTELMEKIKTYSEKSLLLYAMLEIGLVLTVLGYYMTQGGVFLAMFMVVLIFFSLYKPTLERICSHLHIKGEERNFVINSRSIARGEEKESKVNNL
jgi:hypothetical protein